MSSVCGYRGEGKIKKLGELMKCLFEKYLDPDSLSTPHNWVLGPLTLQKKKSTFYILERVNDSVSSQVNENSDLKQGE